MNHVRIGMAGRMDNFGILLDETYTAKLMYVVDYLDDSTPYEVIQLAIDTMFLKIKGEEQDAECR